MFFADLDGVANVIAVAVRAQQDIDFLNILLGVGTHGIVHDPRIDDDGLPCGSFNAEGRMTQPRKLDAFQVHITTTPQSGPPALSNSRSAQLMVTSMMHSSCWMRSAEY